MDHHYILTTTLANYTHSIGEKGKAQNYTTNSESHYLLFGARVGNSTGKCFEAK